MPDFSTRTDTAGDATVIELLGRLDGAATDEMEGIGLPAAGSLLLDFSGVDYINSTGIALLVGLVARARTHEVPVHACGLSDHYRHVFEITRISQFLTIHDDRANAPGGQAPTSAV